MLMVTLQSECIAKIGIRISIYADTPKITENRNWGTQLLNKYYADTKNYEDTKLSNNYAETPKTPGHRN